MALQVWQLAAIEVIYPNGGNGGSSGGGGGGGASASNYIFTPTLETWYPNSTAYEARPLVNVFLESASAANAIAVFEVDTNADNTADLSYRQLLTKVGADNVANSAWFTYSVLPGWQWRVTDASSGGGTVSIDATAPNGNGIWYYATNGGTGGGSGDVTAAGLAAGSFPVAGSAVTGIISNINTAIMGNWQPVHKNLNFPNTWLRLANHQPLKVLFFGDDAFRPSDSVFQIMKENGVSLNGSGSSSTWTPVGNYLYGARAGVYSVSTTYGGTFPGGGRDELFPLSVTHLGNGASYTNVSDLVSGFRTTSINLKAWKSNAFGTISIYTNTVGGTPTLFQSVSCDNGSTLFPFTQSWDLPGKITNCVVSAVSTGTNIMFSLGQWDTNTDAGWRMDSWQGSNLGCQNFVESTFCSNSFRAFLNDYDLIVISDIGVYPTQGATNIYHTLTNSGVRPDIVFTTSTIQSNANPVAFPASLTNRVNCLAIADSTPSAVIDSAVLLWPTNVSTANYYYTDETHLTTLGHKILGKLFWDTFGLTKGKLSGWGYYGDTATNYTFIPANQLMDTASGGNVSMISLFEPGWVYRTWGVRGVKGSTDSPIVTYTVTSDAPKFDGRTNLYTRTLLYTTNSTAGGTATYAYFAKPDVSFVPVSASYAISRNGQTYGTAGSTNFTYTAWERVAPGFTPWVGSFSFAGSGATANGENLWYIGIEFRIEPNGLY